MDFIKLFPFHVLGLICTCFSILLMFLFAILDAIDIGKYKHFVAIYRFGVFLSILGVALPIYGLLQFLEIT